MTLQELVEIVFPNPDRRPSNAQRRILEHPDGPAWASAGPGSGKTDTLALFALRLLYVAGEPFQAVPISPESILVTTFTDKAARNLEDRISRYRARLIEHRPELARLDVSRMRVGTMHGLCNDLLQEAHAASYENVRLMDKFESELFIYDTLRDFTRSTNDAAKLTFWADFSYLIPRRLWNAAYGSPNRWLASRALAKLFNRIVEGRASIDAIRAAGGSWRRLAELYDLYAAALVEKHRCDFAHLQLRFLQFLRSEEAAHLRDGDEHGAPISWVLVDEYQDTNLLQEEIYAALAGRAPHNLVVVGDDDQAMYRFRGASVECMVSFDTACETWLGPEAIARPYALVDNFRSHERIVTFCNEYIQAFPSMQAVGARVPGKPALVPRSRIVGNHPAVGKIEGRDLGAAAMGFAQTVRDLLANGVIEDYSQCCLLLQSTKEGQQNAGPYIDALRALSIPYFNPRNRAFLSQEEVLAILGAIIAVTDADGAAIPRARDLGQLVTLARTTYGLVADSHPQLRGYVERAVENISRNPDATVPTELQELTYLLLALEPFHSWIANDVERRARLSQVTGLIEQYASLPVSANEFARRGRMRAASVGERGVMVEWNRAFYNAFFGYLLAEGINEREDEDIIVPRGRVPIMTIHQAKGLEFPFVFVGHMLKKADPTGEVYQLESAFASFTANPHRRFALAHAAVRAELDVIRQFFVAYSRAQYALVLVGTRSHFVSDGIPCGPTRPWLKHRNVVAL